MLPTIFSFFCSIKYFRIVTHHFLMFLFNQIVQVVYPSFSYVFSQSNISGWITTIFLFLFNQIFQAGYPPFSYDFVQSNISGSLITIFLWFHSINYFRMVTHHFVSCFYLINYFRLDTHHFSTSTTTTLCWILLKGISLFLRNFGVMLMKREWTFSKRWYVTFNWNM